MEPAHIVPAYGKCWPSTRCQPEAVKIRFICGYGDTADTVPTPLKWGLLLLIAHYYENRELVTSGILAEFPEAIDRLIFPYRVTWF